MENPFKEGDRVVILRKGIEAEAVVRTTWRHEVQVRVQGGELIWRTAKTILRTLPAEVPTPDAVPNNGKAAEEIADEKQPSVDSKPDVPAQPAPVPKPIKGGKSVKRRGSPRRKK